MTDRVDIVRSMGEKFMNAEQLAQLEMHLCNGTIEDALNYVRTEFDKIPEKERIAKGLSLSGYERALADVPELRGWG